MASKKKHTSLEMPEFGKLLNRPPQADDDQLKWKILGKALLKASQNAILVVDRDATVIISNELAQKTLALFPGSLLTNTMPELWPYFQKSFQNQNNNESISIKYKESFIRNHTCI